ncbi:MAG: type VI secretion system-associated FHA domain protein TagH [Alphaproteobacteria bacterium]|nr:MAG: type VI secretion system-associated FHA domain protein TagH [Alphaproteobacteria bacterium]
MPAQLHDGDVINIGRYELRVELQEARADPLADLPPPVAPADIAGRAGPAAQPAAGEFVAGLDDPGQGGHDFLDDLLGDAPPGHSRPGQRPADPVGEPILPEDILGPAEPEAEPHRPTQRYDAPSVQDAFRPPPVSAPQTPAAGPPATGTAGAAGGQLIPDDWDLETAPEEAGGTEPRTAPQPGGGAAIPDDWDPGFGAASPPAAPAVPEDVIPTPALPEAAPPQPEPPPVAPTPPQAAATPAPQQAPAAAVSAPSPQTAPAATAATPTPQPAAAPQPAPPRTDAARAFLKAAGVENLEIADDELEEVMARLGASFRTLVEGLREVLIARAAIKNEFRLEQTVISLDGNNPLKFSVSPQHAVESMVKPASPGYLSAAEASREALTDIKAHEVAMMTGMQAAIQGLLKRFDPEMLAGRIETGGLASLVGNRKARLWDQFELIYNDVAREAEDDFQTLFGKEFARAYRAQVKKL